MTKLLRMASAIKRLPLRDSTRRLIVAMLTEAELPDRHAVERLPPMMFANTEEASDRLSRLAEEVIDRASSELAELSDDEWESMVRGE